MKTKKSTIIAGIGGSALIVGGTVAGVIYVKADKHKAKINKELKRLIALVKDVTLAPTSNISIKVALINSIKNKLHKDIMTLPTGVSFSINVDKLNRDGTAQVVVVTLTKEKQSVNKSIKVTPLKTITMIANDKIAEDVKLLDGINKSVVGDPDRIIDGGTTFDILNNLQGVTIEGVNDDITRVYEISTTDSTGVAKVKVTHSSPNGTPQESNFTINGFITLKKETEKAADKLVADDKALFKTFNKTITGKPDKIDDGETKKEILNGLMGVTLPAPTSGVTRKYKVNHDDSTGIATILVTFTAPNTSFTQDTEQFTITGFKTKAEMDKIAAQNKIDSIVEGDLTWISGDISKLSSVVTNFGTNLTNQTLKTVTGLDITFTKVSVADGSIIIKAIISKTGGYTSKEFTKTITGFKTTKMVTQEKIDSIAEGDLTWISGDNSQLSSVVTNFGVNLTDQTLKGVDGLSVTFAKISLADGSITIKATISKTGGYNSKEITKVITGFKTTKMVTQEKIDSIAEGDLTWISGDISKLSNAVTNFGTDLTNTTLKTVAGLSVAFTKKFASDGSIEITATISKAGFNDKVIDKNITGFKTTLMVDTELVNTELAKYTDTTLTQNADITNVLNAINTKLNITNTSGLRITTIHQLVANGTEQTIIISIDKGLATNTKNIKITVLTPTNLNITDKGLFTTYGNKTITGTHVTITNGDILSSALNNIGGITLPTLTSGVARTYKIHTNANGVATITVTHTNTYETKQTSIFTITGFITGAQKIVNQGK